MAIYSRQRDVIMSALKSALYHPTADELYAYLRPSNPSLSLATVYRNLRLMGLPCNGREHTVLWGVQGVRREAE